MASNGYKKRIQNYTYNLDDQIGKGFSSIVYKGINTTTQQQVAIKVINLKQVKDGLAKLMLNNEVDCLKELHHPNVLKLEAVHSTLNNYYIITEFCDGDLASKLKTKGKFNQEEFLPIFKDIFNGYRMMYCYGYIHGDFKPANLLTKQGTIKIADFGFVKKSLNGLRHSQSYNVGTPLYMAPESMKSNVYTYKSDIWSMGVMFYELLTGSTPWKCKNEEELKDCVQKGKIDFSRLTVSQELKDLIKRFLQINQTKRISIGEIQNHPWVLKAMQESKMKLTNSTSGDNPEHSPSAKTQTSSNSLNALKAYLNFGRFIYKMLEYLPKTYLPYSFSNKIEEELSSNLLYCLNFHKQVTITGTNIIMSGDWLQFVHSSDWGFYKQVVLSYDQKYNKRTHNRVPLSYNKQIIIIFIRWILDTESKTLAQIVLLDFLVSYFQLIQLLERVSWDYNQFCKYSQLDSIMIGGSVSEDTDKEKLLQSIKWKLYRMGILN